MRRVPRSAAVESPARPGEKSPGFCFWDLSARSLGSGRAAAAADGRASRASIAAPPQGSRAAQLVRSRASGTASLLVARLAERGVPEADLLSETESRSSFENLSFSKPFLVGKRLLIVTDDLHAYRTGLLARGLGLDAEVATVPARGPRLPYLMREAAGVTAYFLGVHR